MRDIQGNRMTSQAWTGDDFTTRTNPDIIEHVPTAEEAKQLATR